MYSQKPVTVFGLHRSNFIFACIFQGEKAYSCTQCGTRFTYRNGLIKHTKLNRCPKKIVTAEGETIVKKRTRMTGAQGNFPGSGIR